MDRRTFLRGLMTPLIATGTVSNAIGVAPDLTLDEHASRAAAGKAAPARHQTDIARSVYTGFKIRILNLSGAELLTRLGGATTSPWLREMTAADHAYVAELESRAGTKLLEWGYGESLRPRSEVMPYEDWLRGQPRIDFWRAALSWTLYWDAVVHGSPATERWPELLDKRIATDPTLGFLDLSTGHLVWDFQLDLLYRLCDTDYSACQKFRKDWNARRPSARERAASVRLPDGRSLLGVIEERLGAALVGGVPSRAAASIVQALA